MSDAESGCETEIDVSGRFMWDKVTNEFLREHLSDSLIQIDLSTNHVSYESAELLSEFLQRPTCNLEGLCLASCRLTAKSANVIFAALGNSKVVEFYADDNTFSEKNCEVLAESLAKDPPLRLLSVVGCDIPAEGIAAIAGSLKSNRNLKILRVESNSMFDLGAQALAEALPLSGVEELTAGDNEIWNDGIVALMEGCMQTQTLRSVDFAYNILDLPTLNRYLMMGQLEELCVSGCKVNQADVMGFLDYIGRSQLKKLIIDGFNYQVLPVSWPKVRDEIWQNGNLFEEFVKSIENCRTITDLRLGYMELEQIRMLKRRLEMQSGREISVSFHDFGRTWNCWVLEIPKGVFLAPVAKFEWKGGLNEENCVMIGDIVKHTVVEDDKLITEVNMSSCAIPDTLLRRILDSLSGHQLETLNFSSNQITDASLEVLSDFLSKTKVDSLVLDNNKFSDDRCAQFIKSIQELGKGLGPSSLRIGFCSDNRDELGRHATPEQFAELFKSNYQLRSLHLSGPITANDALAIVSELVNNGHVHSIELDSEHTGNYTSPAPIIPEDVQLAFNQLADSLLHVLTDKKSQCKLQTFAFPLLTEVFMYHDDVLSKWPDCEAKMEQNKTSKTSRSRK